MGHRFEPLHPPGAAPSADETAAPPGVVAAAERKAFSELRRLGDVAPDAVLSEADASRRYGARLCRAGRLDALADFAEDLERAARRQLDDRRRRLADLFAATAALEQGRLPFARVRLRRICARGTPGVDARLRSRAHAGMGRLARLHGMPLRALRRLRGAPGGDPASLAEVHRRLAGACVDLGCTCAAAAKLRRGLNLARNACDALEASLAASGLAEVELYRAGPAGAAEPAALALREAEASGSPLARAEAMAAAATVEADSGPSARRRALRRISGALALALGAGAVLLEARLHRTAGTILLEGGRTEAGVRRLTRAREIFMSRGARGPAGRVERAIEAAG